MGSSGRSSAALSVAGPGPHPETQNNSNDLLKRLAALEDKYDSARQSAAKAEEKLARLDADQATLKAEYKTDFARLEADHKTDVARLEADHGALKAEHDALKADHGSARGEIELLSSFVLVSVPPLVMCDLALHLVDLLWVLLFCKFCQSAGTSTVGLESKKDAPRSLWARLPAPEADGSAASAGGREDRRRGLRLPRDVAEEMLAKGSLCLCQMDAATKPTMFPEQSQDDAGSGEHIVVGVVPWLSELVTQRNYQAHPFGAFVFKSGGTPQVKHALKVADHITGEIDSKYSHFARSADHKPSAGADAHDERSVTASAAAAAACAAASGGAAAAPGTPPPGKAWANKAATMAAVAGRKSQQAQKPGPARPRTSEEQRTQAESPSDLVKKAMGHFKAMTAAVPAVRCLPAAFVV
ncbi:hypothetical protein FNF29_07642 [Cafeteria roenbergensis]|uniref:Uncharacterized protein n=1 Tax=Cafeteria roenbergensis TaxID=33653 RepID=A0A5A8C2K8_CAFRO|nr:hypothetical protein FNF29_07642 [Cafeteria roenbergensis]|eukprot:KAA0147015.1 hypothetical protein FNF29_07642 [Cafeteria roenbergensis]